MTLRTPTAVRAAALLAVPALLLAACGGSSSSTGSSAAPSDSATATATAADSATASAPDTAAASSPGGGAADAASSAPFATSDCASLNPPTPADARPDGGTTVDGVTVTAGAGNVPLVTIAKDAPTPGRLVTQDITKGTGQEAKAGSTVTAQYCGVGLTSRTVFDSSWARGGTPATFPLANVIPGWQQGIPGMLVGGRRILIIPGDLAYGANPPTSQILPNETLVFVVDLVAESD